MVKPSGAKTWLSKIGEPQVWITFPICTSFWPLPRGLRTPQPGYICEMLYLPHTRSFPVRIFSQPSRDFKRPAGLDYLWLERGNFGIVSDIGSLIHQMP